MKHGKILVVDDNQGIRNALKLLLTPQFAEVQLIASPKTLVSTMESFMPDVVLLDMNFYTDINTGNPSQLGEDCSNRCHCAYYRREWYW